MKIVCDNCGAKYSIADEKVKGKVFRIRCKKCSNSIVVRGDTPEAMAGGAASATPSAEPAPAPAPAPAAAQQPAPASPTAALPEEDDAQTRVFDYSGYQGSPGGEAVWHVSMDGQQQGPYTKAQVEEFVTAGNLTHEAFIWREGFDDWITLGECQEFSSPAPAPATAAAAPAPADSPFSEPQQEPAPAPATAASEGLFNAGPEAPTAASPFDSGGGLFAAGGEQGSGDLFGGAPDPSAASPAAEGGLFSAPQGAASGGGADDGLFASSGVGQTAEADLFGGGAPASSGGGDMFGVNTAAEPAGGPRVSAEQAMMTGQRSENSVLFSLSNLQALASTPGADAALAGPAATPNLGPTPGPAPGMAGDDASGLIDIRSLAGSLQSAEKEAADDGLMSIGGGGFAPSLGAPVLAASRTGMNKGLLIGMVAGGVVLAAIIVMVAVKFLTAPTEVDNSATDAKIAQLSALLAKMEQKGGGSGDSNDVAKLQEEIANLEAKKAVATGGSPEKEVATAGSSSKKKSPSRSTSSKKSASSSTAKATPTRKPSAKKPASTGDLDDLLGGSAPATRPAAKKKPAAKPAASSGGLPATPTKSDVKSGMNKVASRVKACGRGQSGTLKVKVVINGPTGRIKSAKTTGSFAGTPTGSCAERAVKGARFPKFQKSSLSVTYPFKL